MTGTLSAPPTLSAERHDAVIFDMDGVVTDTARVHCAAWKRMFDEYLGDKAEREGVDFVPFDREDDYLRYVDGRPRLDGARAFLESRGVRLPDGEPSDPPESETVWGLASRKNSYYLEALADGADAYPSTLRLIRTIRNAGVRTAIISASKNVSRVLGAAGVGDVFDARVDGNDAAELALAGKPAPDVFLEAARRLAVDPGRAVVVEDALAGVAAGRAGGFALVIGVDRGDQAEELLRNGADAVVSDLAEVVFEGGR